MNLSTRTQLDAQAEQVAQHLRSGRPHLAMRQAWHLLRRQPGHVPARLLLADAMIRIDDFEQAVRHLDIADTYRRTDDRPWPKRYRVRQLVLRGRALQRLGRCSDAIDCWREATAINPRCVAALRHLANALNQADRHEQALRAAERLLAVRPDDEPTMKLIASAAEATGACDRGITVLRELARRRARRRGRSEGLRFTRSECLRLARLMRQADRIADAMDLYHRLADAVTDDAALACEWALVAVEVGDETRVERLLTTALRAEPNHRTALTMLGQHHMRVGRFVQAGRVWWRLHQLHREAIEPLAHLMVCAVQSMRHALIERVESRLSQRGRPSERRCELAKAWRVAMPGEVLSDLLEGRGPAADTGVLSGLLEEAVGVFENVLPEHRDYADVHYHLAVCHEATGEAAGAAEYFEQALRINPGYVDAACRHADQLIEQGYLDAADAVVLSALDRHPHDERLLDLQKRIASGHPTGITADAA